MSALGIAERLQELSNGQIKYARTGAQYLATFGTMQSRTAALVGPKLQTLA